MRVGPVLVGSVLVHGAILAALAQLTQRARPAPTPPEPIVVTIVPPPSLDLAVMLISDEPVVTVKVPAVHRATTAAAISRAAGTAEAAPSSTEPGPPTPRAPGALHGLGMRGPDLRPPAATMDRIA